MAAPKNKEAVNPTIHHGGIHIWQLEDPAMGFKVRDFRHTTPAPEIGGQPHRGKPLHPRLSVDPVTERYLDTQTSKNSGVIGGVRYDVVRMANSIPSIFYPPCCDGFHRLPACLSLRGQSNHRWPLKTISGVAVYLSLESAQLISLVACPSARTRPTLSDASQHDFGPAVRRAIGGHLQQAAQLRCRHGNRQITVTNRRGRVEQLLKELRSESFAQSLAVPFSKWRGRVLTVSGVQVLMETLFSVTSWFKIHSDDCRLTKTIKTHPSPLFCCLMS
ncbi:hypothetical protein B0T21DRAFT_44747 [Apiosordaria backusii]|uniref:Uncharacterized protein n=1 Tax=Apiosordaria backusii TaxID=314023 RepID=A0AA40E4N4_9PEZI|nr:hypothetical protein B0T21DRAFT_44747 [Apiosordaria backusii]